MKKRITTVIALIMSVAMLAACSQTSPSESQSEATEPPATDETTAPPDAEGDVEMLLAAAASLETSFVEELIPLFEEANAGLTVSGTYDSSGKLQTQIEEGMEASVFMSASPKQMNALVEQGLIEEADVVDLLENEVVLITGVNSDTSVENFEAVLDAETIAIGDPASVPAGQYAQEIFTSLGMWDEIEQKASLGTNVTEVLNQVAEGSAEVGVVYATDAAQIPDKVRVITAAPEGSMDKVIYPVAVLKDAPEREAGELFVEFLQSDEAMAIFEANGFKSNLP